MTTPRDKILALVSSGKITADEGQELMRSLKREPAAFWRTMFSPFDALAAAWQRVIAVTVAALSLSLSLYNVRFDGTLDLHIVKDVVTWKHAVADQLVAWPLTAAVLFAVSRCWGGRGRLIDFVEFVGVARAPQLVAGALVVLIAGDPARSAAESESWVHVAVTLAVLPLLGWFVAMLVNAFRVGSGLKGVRLAVSVVVAIVAAEACSKLALWGLL